MKRIVLVLVLLLVFWPLMTAWGMLAVAVSVSLWVAQAIRLVWGGADLPKMTDVP